MVSPSFQPSAAAAFYQDGWKHRVDFAKAASNYDHEPG
jgi:hypothetical protein